MHPTRLTRRLAAVTATGALAAGLAAPAQADPPGDRPSWAPPAAASVRPDDRADRAFPPGAHATAATTESGDAFDPADALGLALVVTAIGLGVGAMVYTQRLGSA